MVGRKRWSIEDDAKLKRLVEENTNIDSIATKLGKNTGAIIVKSQRLGLQLQTKGYVDCNFLLPKELLSLDEVLKMLA